MASDKPPKITLMIPAYNEEGFIGEVIGPSKEWQRRDPGNREVIVVNDGSTDRTVEIARNAGIRVIHSDPKNAQRNLGKADAVKEGVRDAKRSGSDVVITLDADVRGLKPEQIEKLAEPVITHGFNVAVGKVKPAPGFERFEEHKERENFYSGERAFRVSALEPWLRGNRKWKGVTGYMLETGTSMIPPKRVLADVTFVTEKNERPIMKGRGTAELSQQMGRFLAQRAEWGRVANTAWNLRRGGNRKEARRLLGRKQLKKPRRL